MATRHLSQGRKLRKVFKKIVKTSYFRAKIWTKLSPKLNLNILYEFIGRSYVQFNFFPNHEIWQLTKKLRNPSKNET